MDNVNEYGDTDKKAKSKPKDVLTVNTKIRGAKGLEKKIVAAITGLVENASDLVNKGATDQELKEALAALALDAPLIAAEIVNS